MNKTILVNRVFETIPTCDEFVTWMKSDMTHAKELFDTESKIRKQEWWENYKTNALQRIRKEIDDKYKRQSTRDKYYKTRSEEWLKKYSYCSEAPIMSRVYWDLTPWSFSSNSFSVYFEKDLEEQLVKMYQSHVDNKYFTRCKGWNIKENSSIDLIFDDDVQAEWDKDVDDLNDRVDRFYAGSNYRGD